LHAVLREYMDTRKDIDVVITTVNLPDYQRPFVVVSPLLLEEDTKKIDHLLMRLSQIDLFISSDEKQDSNLLGRLEKLPKAINAAKQILENYFLLESETEDISGMITLIVSKLFSEEKVQMEVQKAFQDREEIGTTFFKENSGVLLHCRTQAVHKAYFGFSYMKGYAAESGEKDTNVKYAAVMIAPFDMGDEMRSIFGEISRNLIENTEWLKLIHNQESEGVRAGLEYILEKYIHQSLSKREEQQ